MTNLTLEQRFEIALDMLCAKLTTTEVCYKHGVTASCAYHIKNRALEVLRAGIGQSVRQSNKRSEHLLKRLGDLEQRACDQGLAISVLKLAVERSRAVHLSAGRYAVRTSRIGSTRGLRPLRKADAADDE